MTKPIFNIALVLEAIKQNKLIITPNQRLARAVMNSYAEFQHNQGLTSWYNPQVFPLESWWQHNWDQLIAKAYEKTGNKQLLTQQQELILWERVIRNSKAGQILLRPAATAKIALKAFTNLKLWNINTNDPLFSLYQDTLVFNHWQNEFKNHLNKNKLISLVETIPIIEKAFKEKILNAPSEIILLGFTDLPPLYENTLNTICGNVELLQPYLEPQSIKQYIYPDVISEIKAAAIWARNIFQQDDQATVGIFVPNLNEKRNKIENIFTEIFEPTAVLPSQTRYSSPFNVSAGSPLSECPIIYSLLQILSLNNYEVSIQTVSSFLKSPFIIAAESENEPRNMADIKLRELEKPNVSTAELRAVLAGSIQGKEKKYLISKQLSQALQQFEKFKITHKISNHNTHHMPSHWINLFQQQLNLLGWPGERTLDSIEYQQIKHWHEVVQQFSKLNIINGKVNFKTAIKLLKQCLNEHIFHAQTSQSQLQILGLLESSGLTFDHVWVLGLNNKIWPPPPDPNPFIPIQIQKDNEMPHATASRQLAFAKKVTENLLSCANHIVVSSTQLENDLPCHPSALIQHIDSVIPDAMQTDGYCEMIAKQSAIETLNDDSQCTINDDETHAIKGGSTILQNQAACPFRAFAIHRLNALPLKSATTYLTAKEKGISLHRALEYLWGQLKDLRNLKSLSDKELEAIIKNSAEYGLQIIRKLRPDLLTPRFYKIEAKRLEELLSQWLEIEKKRTDFSVIAKEASMKTNFNGLPIKLRIDRIDHLENGSYVIIDYKSKQANIKSWEGDRPDEPQLPLYFLLSEFQINNISYAIVNRDNPKYIGIGNDESIPGLVAITDKYNTLPNTWDELKIYWHDHLANLTHDFIQGAMNIDPKNPVQTCQYCHLQSFCRIKINNEIE